MNLTIKHFLVVAGVLALTGMLLAFDIAVYGDARGNINAVTTQGCYCQNQTMDGSRDLMINHMRNENDLWRWLEEMGVTHMKVYYPRRADFIALQSRPVTTLKIMDDAYAWQIKGGYYVSSQNRDLFPGEAWTDTSSNRWLRSDLCSLIPSARQFYDDRPYTMPKRLLAFGPDIENSNGSPSYLWNATNNGAAWVGTWNGWAGTQREEYGVTDSVCQPIHIRISCDAEPVTGGPDELLTFSWLVQDGDGWIRYPFTVRLSNFDDPGDDIEEFDTLIVPRNITCERLNSSFQHDQTLTNYFHSYGRGTTVSMQMYYHGTNNVFLYEIEVWDEGYHRMFMEPNDSVRMGWIDQIGDALEQEWALTGGRSAGWYFDEWVSGDDDLQSLVFINKILQDRGLPTMFINGYGDGSGDISTGRDDLYAELNRQGVRIPVHMNEFYMFGADYPNHWTNPIPYCAPGNLDTVQLPCAPRRGEGGIVLEMMPTDSSSDAPYLDIDEHCGWGQYAGKRSLQCAIDVHLWDFRPVYESYDLEPPFAWMSIDDIPTTMCLIELHPEGWTEML